MEEGTGGQRKGRKRRKEMRRELRWKRERGQCESLFTLWSFIPLFKIHSRFIRRTGTITGIPLILQT